MLFSGVLCVLAAITHVASAQVPHDVRAYQRPREVFANTEEVVALAASEETVWVATHGGLEEYDVASGKRRRTYSTLDGLSSLFAVGVSLTATGQPVVQLVDSECALGKKEAHFTCRSREPSSPVPSAHPFTLERIEGVRVTAQLVTADGGKWFGTHGLGVWRSVKGRLRRVTPVHQLCGNHVVAMSEYGQAAWFATFDRGLCRWRDGEFGEVALEPKLLNDVLATKGGLFVATSQGLFVSTDGVSFARDLRVRDGAITDLAYDEKRGLLYATSTSALWEVPVDTHNTSGTRAVYRPGGSRSLQAVDVGKSGEVWLASEDRGVMRRVGRRKFEIHDRPAGYPSSWAVDVLALPQGGALFASLRHGLFEVDSKGRGSFAAPQERWLLFLGRDDRVSVGAVLIGTQAGAWVVDRDGQTQSIEGLPDSRVHALGQLSTGLWVATEVGLARY